MNYEFAPDWLDEGALIEGEEDVRFSAQCTQFNRAVRLVDCTVTHLDLYATYFLDSFEMVNCQVHCDVNWQSGGHNKGAIRIVDTEFHGFVDVEDCCFDADLVLRNVTFHKGTNLLGNQGTPVAVHFEVAPVLEDVEGRLDWNTFSNDGGDPTP